jgi:hypothetical protein
LLLPVSAADPADPAVAASITTTHPITGIDSVTRTVASSSSGVLIQAKNAVAKAVSEAIATACQGDVNAASQALAVAVANASATAWVSGVLCWAVWLLSNPAGSAGLVL